MQQNQYDYILIDNHPDFSTITPSEHEYNAKFDLEMRLEKFIKQVVNYATGETYIVPLPIPLFFQNQMIL